MRGGGGIAFWSGVGSRSVRRGGAAEWLEEVEDHVTGVEKQENIK